MIERLATISQSDILSLSGPIGLDLPQPVRPQAGAALPVPDTEPLTSLHQATEQFQRAYIQQALDRCGGNVSRAARLLGIHRSAIYRKLGKQ